jgi:hypothetical protein
MEHELIDRLVRDATPVRPLALPSVRLRRWAIVTAICLATSVAVVGVRHELDASMRTLSFVVQAGLLLGTALVSAAAALVCGVPGAHAPRVLRFLPVLATAAWSAWLVAAILGQPGTSRVWWPSPSPQCAVDITLIGLVPGLLLWSYVRRAAPLRPGWTGLLATLTAASVGALGTHLICPVGEAAHLLVWHVVPVALLAAAGIRLGQRALHWPVRPQSTTALPDV